MTGLFPYEYLIISALLFAIGATGVAMRRNVLMALIGVELMLNAANLALAVGARLHNNLGGHVLIVLVMVAAAAEVAVGLAVAVRLFREKNTLDMDSADTLRN